MTELGRLQIELHRWADQVFGENRSPHGPIAHLIKEAAEVYENPYDIMEYVDCLTLVLDAASNAGINVDDLLNAAWEKLEINRQRKWGKPGEDGVVEHIRD